MQFGANINTLMQTVMAMRSPDLMARMPDVEAMPYEERVALVRRGHANIDALIRGWDKFGDLLAAQGWSRQDVKRKAKGLKNAREKLEMGLRLTDRKKIPPAFHDKADAAFDVLAAWFLMDAGYLEDVLRGPRLTKEAVATGDVGQLPAPAAASVHEAEPAEDDAMDGVDMVEAEMPAPSHGREAGDLVDAVDRDEVHPAR